MYNTLKKGFTNGTTATTADLMLTVALAEARDTKTTLYAACIDASLVIDVVWHNSVRYVNFTTWAYHLPVWIS